MNATERFVLGYVVTLIAAGSAAAIVSTLHAFVL
jgi:hypothetical protein